MFIIYLSIYLSIYLVMFSIYLSIYLCGNVHNLSIYLSIYLSIDQNSFYICTAVFPCSYILFKNLLYFKPFLLIFLIFLQDFFYSLVKFGSTLVRNILPKDFLASLVIYKDVVQYVIFYFEFNETLIFNILYTFCSECKEILIDLF